MTYPSSSSHPKLQRHPPNIYRVLVTQPFKAYQTNTFHINNFTTNYKLQTTSNLAKMAALVLALGAAIYITAEKIQDHREKKRALKAKNASKQALLKDDDSIMAIEDLPAYQREKLPAYEFVEQHQQQHPALVPSERIESSGQRQYTREHAC
ncbi:hypothetical protein MGYG_01248 [Nannizzia gypsea CBS 118893]|uniref:Uncharacterized protein n=1 Tax=Arthroderma gypseum (strain ATCC MYA-4604 / CBS 118893) TaxID=535722 RepID=E5QZR1_ARTGP|nr:hypothetical protein MGYG_01248 [Nannizzia gypsea CBS 118893]EFQ98212.1 hypothetical protein MGYG_01248 [Nannizzia gypsea CBS 118893]